MTVSTSPELPSLWGEFLDELDKALSEPVELHCIGGFVISVPYGLPLPIPLCHAPPLLLWAANAARMWTSSCGTSATFCTT